MNQLLVTELDTISYLVLRVTIETLSNTTLTTIFLCCNKSYHLSQCLHPI